MASVNLDRPRAIKWTHRADARLGSLERPPLLRDLAHKNPRKAFYALLAFVWASLEDSSDFPDPESLAQHLGPDDKQFDAWNGLKAALEDGGIIETQKKSPTEMTSTG